MIAAKLAYRRLGEVKQDLTQFRGFRIPGCKALAVNLTQRANKYVAVLAADYIVLVAMASVQPRFAHAALPLSQPQSGRLSLRHGDSNSLIAVRNTEHADSARRWKVDSRRNWIALSRKLLWSLGPKQKGPVSLPGLSYLNQL